MKPMPNSSWLVRFSRLHQAMLLGLAVLLLTPLAVAEPDAEVDSLVADMLTRYAIAALDSNDQEPREDQGVRAEVLLDMALELSPDDADLWRLRAYQARAAEDSLRFREAMTRYVELEPTDDAAMFDLLVDRLAEFDTLDARLDVLDRLLNRSDASQMTDALRSRLASSAAGLSREMGDDRRHLSYLKTAVRADTSNGEAAQMAYEFAVSRDAAPLQLGGAAMNLVRARPLDAAARLRLAEALASLGDYTRAAEQYAVAERLGQGIAMPAEYQLARARSLINSGQDREAIALLDRIAATFVMTDEDGKVNTTEVPLEVELLRHVVQQGTSAGQSALQRVIERLEAGAQADNGDAKLDLAWVQAVFGDSNLVADLLDGQPQDDPRYARASGFVYLKDGSERWARSTFERIAATDAVAAYGLAEIKGVDKIGRARFMGEVVRDAPQSFGATLAAREIQKTGKQVPTTDAGLSLRAAMDRLPTALWRLDDSARSWVGVRANFPAPQTLFVEPINVKLTLTNHSELPVAIGEPGAMGETLIASIGAFTGGRSIGELPPFVESVGRRLTLQPGETLDVNLRLDRSFAGLLMLTQAPATYTYNASFTVDPTFLPNGGMVGSALGGFDTVRSLQLIVAYPKAERINQWIVQTQDADAFTRMTAFARLARLGEAVRQVPDLDPASAQAAIQALNDAYDRLPLNERTWVLLWLEAQDNNRSPYQSILDQAKRSEQDLERITYLMGAIPDAAHPAITSAIRDGSPRIKRFAEAWRSALEARSTPAAEVVSP